MTDHYQAALAALENADAWIAYGGWADRAEFDGDYRMQGRTADLLKAQVHATLHLAQATSSPTVRVDAP